MRDGAALGEQPALDLGDGGGRLGDVHGDAHDLRARRGERRDLRRRAGDVGRVGAGHGLDDHRCAAAHLDVADLDADRAMKTCDVHGRPANGARAVHRSPRALSRFALHAPARRGRRRLRRGRREARRNVAPTACGCARRGPAWGRCRRALLRRARNSRRHRASRGRADSITMPPGPSSRTRIGLRSRPRPIPGSGRGAGVDPSVGDRAPRSPVARVPQRRPSSSRVRALRCRSSTCGPSCLLRNTFDSRLEIGLSANLTTLKCRFASVPRIS